MYIRVALPKDLEDILRIYEHARDFMARTGNPKQWGPTHWPPERLVRKDIATGKGYVCEQNGRVVGVFFYDEGIDIEPTYAQIDDGAWLDDGAYGVIHRIASDGTVRGVGTYCLEWAFARSGHLRIDTHTDNKVMQNLLHKLGFIHCGTIYVYEDRYPRMAFEKVEGRGQLHH